MICEYMFLCILVFDSVVTVQFEYKCSDFCLYADLHFFFNNNKQINRKKRKTQHCVNLLVGNVPITIISVGCSIGLIVLCGIIAGVVCYKVIIPNCSTF